MAPAQMSAVSVPDQISRPVGGCRYWPSFVQKPAGIGLMQLIDQLSTLPQSRSRYCVGFNALSPNAWA
ncbi:hypothetical protein D3C72_2036680 [compost metagenome]